MTDAAARRQVLSSLRALDNADPLYGRRLLPLLMAYAEGVPRVRLSRCPLSGDELVHSLDTFGLDGLWWDYEMPLRPDERALPATFYSLTGALSLHGAPEYNDAIVRPGPSVPFVVPWMLSRDGVVAVVSHVKVGAHDGYAIVYFAPAPAPGGRRFNTWGMGRYDFMVGAQAAWSVSPEGEEHVDYDLAPWLSSGKLQWIAPGDASLTLRTGVDGCPFVGLSGDRTFASIRYGRVFGSTITKPPE